MFYPFSLIYSCSPSLGLIFLLPSHFITPARRKQPPLPPCWLTDFQWLLAILPCGTAQETTTFHGVSPLLPNLNWQTVPERKQRTEEFWEMRAAWPGLILPPNDHQLCAKISCDASAKKCPWRNVIYDECTSYIKYMVYTCVHMPLYQDFTLDFRSSICYL